MVTAQGCELQLETEKGNSCCLFLAGLGEAVGLCLGSGLASLCLFLHTPSLLSSLASGVPGWRRTMPAVSIFNNKSIPNCSYSEVPTVCRALLCTNTCDS